jgi:transketolase
MSVGVGLALATKLNGTNQYCYVLVGDGELNEGAIWEAALFAAQFKLDNLIVIVDENRFQAMGPTNEVMSLGDISKKFEAFGFDAINIDGHNEQVIDVAYAQMKELKNGKPKCIVANTVKGKGVSFMEHNNIWHYTRLSEETYKDALTQLEEKK